MDQMPLEQKISLLMSLAGDDREASPSMPAPLPPRLRHANDVGALRPLNFRTVSAGRGRRTTLLRILMTNACSFNCHYCPMRRDRELPRTLLKPEELVRIFLGALERGWCQGLFITTGIPGRPAHVMDELIKVLELLRERHRFPGYIHVKLVPGSEENQIDRPYRGSHRAGSLHDADDTAAQQRSSRVGRHHAEPIYWLPLRSVPRRLPAGRHHQHAGDRSRGGHDVSRLVYE